VKDITEIRWHGRAGQGTVSAAKLLAETALEGGLHVQAFPEYGPEREGAPLKAYNRISKETFAIYHGIDHPHVVLVVDNSLLKMGEFKEGTNEKTVFIINSPEKPDVVKSKFGLEKNRVCTVDATGICLDTVGRNIPNTPMLGALARVTGVIELDGLVANLRHEFGKKFAEDMVERNVQAVQRAHEEVIEG
jgi:pyruvate ferredoxin oxidoreductase gamma subunit